MQMSEREAVDQHTKLLAFDRQNHMGASNKAAGQISDAIRQEAEAQLAEKKFVTGEVNIKENVDKMKVLSAASWIQASSRSSVCIMQSRSCTCILSASA